MEVTRSNFKNNLESIAESISEASFISFDGEFTGLSQGKGINAFDTPEERYLKLKEGATNFLLIQFGLCAFKYDSKKKMYTHRAFNFYIFPRPYKRGAPDFRFLCQV
ncbi:PARN (predicted) [Pycnogonum litorale]